MISCRGKQESQVWAMDRETFRNMLISDESTKKKTSAEGFRSCLVCRPGAKKQCRVCRPTEAASDHDACALRSQRYFTNFIFVHHTTYNSHGVLLQSIKAASVLIYRLMRKQAVSSNPSGHGGTKVFWRMWKSCSTSTRSSDLRSTGQSRLLFDVRLDWFQFRW